jgi:hypothetical protein
MDEGLVSMRGVQASGALRSVSARYQLYTACQFYAYVNPENRVGRFASNPASGIGE